MSEGAVGGAGGAGGAGGPSEEGSVLKFKLPEPFEIKNDFPHITISTADGTMPVYSNTMLTKYAKLIQGAITSGKTIREGDFTFEPIEGSVKMRSAVYMDIASGGHVITEPVAWVGGRRKTRKNISRRRRRRAHRYN
jgi:hypothetical protein